MIDAEQFNQAFGIENALAFAAHPSGLICVEMSNRFGQASLSLQGAHLFHWQPINQTVPVLWLSSEAKFAPGKSIRGGIPVCWPWFGPHASGASFPAHGFARTSAWKPVGSSLSEDGAVSLTLRLLKDASTEAFWAYGSELELTVKLAASLQLSLSTRNTGSQEFVLGEALHTYFQISDIGTINVRGLEGAEYWDTVGGVEKKRQQGAIHFTQETDRVYINSDAGCTIEDSGFKRRIHISKRGSQSTVVWNPWTDKANRMGDLGQPDGWRGMVCVESANAWDNRLTVAPGTQCTLAVEYRVESF
jgi:D-hexose-6-phosphate mutarotase